MSLPRVVEEGILNSMSKRRFPVISRYQWERSVQDKSLVEKCPRSIPWALIAPYEERARYNHDQSLQTLAARGGLDPVEMWCVLHDKNLLGSNKAKITLDEAIRYLIEVTNEREAVEHRSDV